MNDILLDLRLGEKSFDCLRKALQSIDTYGQDICHAAVLQAVQNRKPQLCAFVLANIHTENVLMTVHIYPDRDIDRTLYKPAFIPYMVIGRIHENDCIDFFQRPFLPFFYDGKDFIRDPADGAVRNLNVIQFAHMAFNISCCHPFGIHGEDLFLHVLSNCILVFFYNLWLKLSLSASGDIDFHIAITGMHGFQGMSVSEIIGLLVVIIIPGLA